MKKLILAVALASVASVSLADQWVSGHVRRDGTYVQPYMRSEPDGIRWNNYSSQGNVNPYTGSYGTQNPYSNPYQLYTPNPYRLK